MADIQTEKAYRRQSILNNYNKYLLYGEAQPVRKTVRKKKGTKVKKTQKRMKAIRYFKKVGLGFKTLSDAIQGNYIDKKCPFTGNVIIRGRIIKGIFLSTKVKHTIIVRRDFLHFIRKYQRYQKHHHNSPAHCSPAFKRITEGDIATIGQCRPLFQTKRYQKLYLDVEIANVKIEFLLELIHFLIIFQK